MSAPWDIPPLPRKGDDDILKTFAGVGWVLSEWEEIELILSQLYSFLIGKPYHIDAMHEYGTGSIFRDRIKILIDKASIYIRNQEIEAKFDKVIEECIAFSNRRNEIAHGIVRPIEMLYPPPEDPTVGTECKYFLVPAEYQRKRFDPDDLPIYAYTWPMMVELAKRLSKTRHKVIMFLYELYPEGPLSALRQHEP